MSQNVVKIRNSSDEGISSQQLQQLVTPAKTGRKRHLSLPNINGSNVKKAKGNEDSDNEHMNKRNLSESESEKHEPKKGNEETTKQERVTLRVRRSIIPKDRLKNTKSREKKVNSKNEDGEKTKSRVDNSKKEKTARQPKENKSKETVKYSKTEKHITAAHEQVFNNNSDTSVILEALDNMKNGLENKIETIEKKPNEHLGKLKDEMNSIRDDFNLRLEGLAKKVEIRVLKAVENDTKEKLNKLEKGMKKDMDKMKRNLDKTEAGVKKLSQADLPTVQEKLGDEIDKLVERVTSLQNKKTTPYLDDKQERIDERKRKIVIRNLIERENENIKDRVNNIIDYLKIKNICVESAERKVNNYNSKPGVVIATFFTSDDKENVMQVKKNLKNGSRYRDVYLENDVPVHQRKMKNNLRTIVNTLGREKLKLRGSRIIRADENTDPEQNRNYLENESRERTRPRYSTQEHQGPYETGRQRSNGLHRDQHDTTRNTSYSDQQYHPRDRQDDRDRLSQYKGDSQRRR